MQYYCGVPERVLEKYPALKENSLLVVAHESDFLLDDVGVSPDPKILEGAIDFFGKEGTNPADVLYVFEEGEPDEPEITDDYVKNATAQAYDQVGQTAGLKGNLKKAKAVMTYLGYTEKEIEIAGEDAYNYQGVGNPHNFAKIQPGEKVLDLGSGLGIDSFLASYYAGPEGKVVGLDISKGEVKHSTARAEKRGLEIKFIVADME